MHLDLPFLVVSLKPFLHVLGGLGVVACYVWRESRYREWAAAAGILVGLATARIVFF